jgi:hypothetical protein
MTTLLPQPRTCSARVGGHYRSDDHYRQPVGPLEQDIQAAAPYRGQTLQVVSLDLNRDRDRIEDLLKTCQVEIVFGLHPALGVKAVDMQGRFLPQDGSLVMVTTSKTGVQNGAGDKR